MGDTEPLPETKTRKDWTLAYILAAGVGVVSLIALATAPVAHLLGDSQYAIPSSLHGAAAMVYVVIATILAYLGLLLYQGRLNAYRDLRILALLQAFFSLVTIMFGNWIYIYYRAAEGPRTYFLENHPPVHEVFFEFKEFIALFTLPLAVSVAYITWHERGQLQADDVLQKIVAVLLWLAWGTLVLAFGLGAAITKIRGVRT
jgi:hypothetical protein